MNTALDYIETKLKLSMDKFKETSTLLQDLMRSRQMTLDSFIRF
jgi:hypothetical protein